MSGHSKWSTIKHKKAAADAKRGKAFSYVSRLIRVAVKEGGSGDPSMNPSLRVALDKARGVNMPKENIDRAIDKGLGKAKNGAVIEEVLYEGYAPGGVGVLAWAVTDNRNRTGAEIRNAMEKVGGSLGGPGAAAYLFDIKPNGEAEVKIPLMLENEADRQKVEELVEALEELDDVEFVATNLQ